jgi:hypothetical protein
MRLLIEIDMTGAAFEARPATEVIAVVGRMPADAIALAYHRRRPGSGTLADSNGNTTGTWAVKKDKQQRKKEGE